LSIRKKSIQGAAWTTAGYMVSQVLRLASNMVLARLLAPEHFGVMAIINVFLIGLNMFSDVGIGPNIVQSKHGDDKTYLNTAWTLQLIRGGLIWLVCLAAAWPMALFYNEPLLFWAIPVAGLTVIISGANSTNIFTAYRHLNLGKLTFVELVSQALALLLMIGIAQLHPSIWVLIAGSLFGTLIKMLASHFYMPGILNWFCWDRVAVKDLFGFGQWIFFATLLNFAGNSAGSLILGKFVSMTEVGLFTIGTTLAKAVEQAFEQIAQKVLLPVYAKFKELGQEELKAKVFKIRAVTAAIFLPLLWVLILLSQWIIDLLFDPRYQGAAWIMKAFAIGLIPTVVSGLGPFYLALGNSKLMMKISALKLVAFIVFIALGWQIDGASGLIYGMAFHTIVAYFYDLRIQLKYGIFMPVIDGISLGLSALVVAVSFYY
jgi:O-antigen/teichoic acid export membrane protein